jgi:SAM-dependent methyltransferase
MSQNERGQVATSAADVYEEFFVPALFGAWPSQVLDAGGVVSGDRVLDVACGTGVLARASLDRVGEDGHVVGLDPNEGMLSVARRLGPRVEWRRGVAEELPFSDASFDRVVSQFGMMFFSDPEKAADEMARVLVAGGAVAIAVWASLKDTPGYQAMADLIADLFGDETAGALRAPYSMGHPDEVRDVMLAAFPDIVVTEHEGVARFDSIDAWVHTDIRGWTLAEMIDDDQYGALVAEARRRLSRFSDESGKVSFAAPALIATATAR